MRSLSFLSLTFAVLLSASSAEAYFRVLPIEEVTRTVRTSTLAVDKWPGWVGMPGWVQGSDTEDATPPSIVQTGSTGTENWPLWIDRPSWLQ